MSLKNKTISGTFWVFLEQISEKGVNFLVQIVLARILAPEDFGLIAMMTIFLSIGQALVEGGLNQSLVRTVDADQKDYSSVFFLNIIFSLFVYGIIYLVAPFVADFYGNEQLTNLLRALSLIIPINAFNIVQKTILTKEMDFKTQMLIQTPSLLIAGLAAIYLAKQGFKAWALVYMQLIFASLLSIQYWLFTKWRPRLIFHLETIKKHFSFGYKITLSTFINSFFTEIYNIVIGKFYSASTLGLYNRAYTFQYLPGFIFTRTLGRVVYPLFSHVQDDNEKLKTIYKEMGLQVMLVYLPIVAFFFFMADEFILFVLGEQWTKAGKFLKLLILSSLFLPIDAFNWNVIMAKGRSDVALKLNTLVKGVTLISVLFVAKIGIIALIVCQIFANWFTFSVFSINVGRTLKYSFFNQILNYLPLFLIATIVGFISFYINQLLALNSLFSMIVYLTIFFVLYIVAFYLLNYQPFHQLRKTVIETIVNQLKK